MQTAKRLQIILNVLLAGLLLTSFSVIAWAAPEATGTLIPTDDSYTDSISPVENPAFGTLYLAFSDAVEPRPTKIVFLKFDLAGVTFPIQQARLNMAAVTGCMTPDAVNVAVYGALDVYNDTNTPWTETGINWNNQPDRDPTAISPLITMDESEIKLDGGYHHWTDTGAGYFADWLETQRVGDDVATLRLEIMPNPGSAEVWFEDSEGTAAGFLTCIASGGPALQVADATGPLSITLLDMHAGAASPGSRTAWFSLLAAALLGLGVCSLKRRVD